MRTQLLAGANFAKRLILMVFLSAWRRL